MECFPLGDRALIVRFGSVIHRDDYEQARSLYEALLTDPFPWMTECVLSYSSVTVYYDPLLCKEDRPYDDVRAAVLTMAQHSARSKERERVVISIPVCYGGEHGPDLDEVAAYHRLTTEEVVQLHTETEYLVHFIGFVPGFPYLGGMNERLATPRRSTPRLSVPAGSVGIGGVQTGVYPFESPGGWNIIGRTPVSLFQPDRDPPVLLEVGSYVRFNSIAEEEFHNWRGCR